MNDIDYDRLISEINSIDNHHDNMTKMDRLLKIIVKHVGMNRAEEIKACEALIDLEMVKSEWINEWLRRWHRLLLDK